MEQRSLSHEDHIAEQNQRIITLEDSIQRLNDAVRNIGVEAQSSHIEQMIENKLRQHTENIMEQQREQFAQWETTQSSIFSVGNCRF